MRACAHNFAVTKEKMSEAVNIFDRAVPKEDAQGVNLSVRTGLPHGAGAPENGVREVPSIARDPAPGWLWCGK